MGNYFRQIYTGSHAEWWTTVFDPHGQAGEGLLVFFLGGGVFGASTGQWEGVGSWVGEEKGDGGQLVERREGRVINWRSSSGSASIVGAMGQTSAALMALPVARLASPHLHPHLCPAPPRHRPRLHGGEMEL